MQAHNALTAAMTGSPSQAGETVLRTYDLTKHYGSRVAVNQLNLEVRRGEIVGCLGPNGAGKTTSIRMLLSLIAPTSGRIELFGRDLASEHAHLLPRIGALVETLHRIGSLQGTYHPFAPAHRRTGRDTCALPPYDRTREPAGRRRGSWRRVAPAR